MGEQQEEINGGRRGRRDICFMSDRLQADSRVQREKEWMRTCGRRHTEEEEERKMCGKTLARWKCLIGTDWHYHKLQNSKGMSRTLYLYLYLCVCVCLLASVFLCVYAGSRCCCISLGWIFLHPVCFMRMCVWVIAMGSNNRQLKERLRPEYLWGEETTIKDERESSVWAIKDTNPPYRVSWLVSGSHNKMKKKAL